MYKLFVYFIEHRSIRLSAMYDDPKTKGDRFFSRESYFS